MSKKDETICVRGTYRGKDGEPAVLPLNQATTYIYNDGDHLADLFALKATGHLYSRISNPTVSYLEEKVNLLEGGTGCLSAATGHAAIINSFLNLCRSGDHIIASSQIYGGVYSILKYTLPKLGITTTFVDQDEDLETLKKALQPNTKLVFAEMVSNPLVKFLDIKKFKVLANSGDIPLIIDNTLLTACLFKPFEFGANIVVHSGSKYYDGHGAALAGFIIENGKFDYTNGKFPDFVNPDEAYHGLSYSKDLGEVAYITKARVQLTRDLGNLLNPFNAYLINMSMETLHLRMERHSENALALAKFLEKHPKIKTVHYGLLPSSPDYNIVKDLNIKGLGGILAFEIDGGSKEAKDFTASLDMTLLMTHLGDARTSVIHPASTTHSQMSDEDLKKAGVSPNLVRVSVGLESIDDIIADFEKALS